VPCDAYSGKRREQESVETIIASGGRNSLDVAGELEMGTIQARRVVSIQNYEIQALPPVHPVKGWKPWRTGFIFKVKF
jgi:hypothetical protein